MAIRQLIFVYNAGSGVFNSVTDFAHKILSPSTYDCRLCALTYGNFAMNREWKNFIETLPVPSIFLHRDEFLKNYHQEFDLPAVFYKEEQINVFLSKQTIEQCTSIRELMVLVSSELSTHDQHHHYNI